MKILSVRFQNLNSLKGEHEIRFDQSPLAEAGLFAITGQTGAGKTTILDAITVGLYGLVHRHNNQKPLELMTRHTAESYAEVEFEANAQRYRSKWQIRRSRGKIDGNIQPIHMELYSFAEDSLFDLKPSQVPDKVAELCGLDYSQFLRSVMLSQGDFARFLKADPNERSSLLEKITDTGIYSDISRFAYEKAKTERLKKEELEHRLQDSKLLPEEQRLAYQEKIKELTAQEALLQKEANTLQEQVQWLQQLTLLQQKQEQQQKALAEQETKLAQLQPDFQKLEQHEQARQYEGQLTRIELANGQLVQVQTQLETLVKQVPLLEAELEAAGFMATEAGKAHQQQEETVQKLEPLLDKVIKLDQQKASVREQYLKGKAAYVQFDEALKQEQAQLQQKQEELNALTQKANLHKDWLQQNQRLQDLPENLYIFRQAVKDLNDAEQSIKKLQQEQQAIQGQLQQDAQQSKEHRQQQEQLLKQQENTEQQKKEKLAQLQAVLADKSMEQLEAAAQEQPHLLSRYEKLLDLAQQHHTQHKKQEQLSTQLTQQEQEAAHKKKQQQEIQQKYAEGTVRLEELQKLVLLQQRIQEYELARLNLQPHQPCPLCGSEHHPYVDGDYTSTLSEDERKCDQQQKLVKELEVGVNTLNLELHRLQHQLETTAQQKKETALELERLQQFYTQQSAGINFTILDLEQLAQQLQAQKEKAGVLDNILSQARSCSKELEGLNQQLQLYREENLKQEAKLNQLTQSEKHWQAQLSKVEFQLQDLQEQQLAHTETLESFAASYGLKYSAETRQENLRKLEDLAATYQQKQQALDQMRDAYINLNAEVKNLDIKVKEKQKEQQERQQMLKEEHQQLTQLKEERAQLFGDKDPQQERQLAQQELRAKATQAETARAKLQQKQQELRESQQRQQQCKETHQQHKSALDELRDGLLQVLRQQGIDTIEALSLMLLQKDEANRLANLKSQTEKSLTEMRRSLTDVQQELAQTQAKKLTEESIDVLVEQQQQKTQQKRVLIEEQTRCKQLLEQDEVEREKNRSLAEQLKTQQQVCQRWAQLSDLIGSSSGDKFSRFAQGLTLARLVELANRHLQKLNDRYRILKSSEDDLELLIVDTYQAEAIRPMNSLSGGESFLVSLALALGLSDLAGRRTQINSLFIDEGFGTLDAETLDAAISTLENLQANGKMIGIISHVEALKERIGTQIKVQKVAGGVSKIMVVGW
ncbi:AAA family ATPase [Pontibacter harenae]|uniref:AAA family ATPase n=1 Tax=Pontibacter harenae TaxID=2894083 RepID=UPI001E344023|nr:AAA family ATPase [Pontibacter harenae]MCC9166918.1 AAA family ATPase [Pontibacter harenae]